MDCCRDPDVAVTVIMAVVAVGECGVDCAPQPLSRLSPIMLTVNSNSICIRRRFFHPKQHKRAARAASGNSGRPPWPRVEADVEEAVSVRVDCTLPFALGVIEVGESVAVTPAGRPETLRLTAELKLFVLVIVIVLVPLLPWSMVNAAGEAPRVKLGVAFTVRTMVVVADRLPEVPVMVTVAVPEVAESLAVSVNTLVSVVGFEPNIAVTPLGRPVAASATLPVNPLAGATVMVLAALPP